MAFDVPFSILVLFVAVAMTIGVLGVILGFKKVAGAPFITIFAGIIIFALFVLIDEVEVDYHTASTSNSTCQNVAGKAKCDFSYLNSTGKFTNKPDGIPIKYKINNFETGAYLIFLTVIFIWLGVVLHLRDWSN